MDNRLLKEIQKLGIYKSTDKQFRLPIARSAKLEQWRQDVEGYERSERVLPPQFVGGRDEIQQERLLTDWELERLNRNPRQPNGPGAENPGLKMYKEIFNLPRNRYEFVGAQPLQYMGKHTIEILRNAQHITFSPKLDGTRFLCLISGRTIAFFGREFEMNQYFHDGSRSKSKKKEKVVVLDIEYVDNLKSKSSKSGSIFAFDILIDKGVDVRELPYTARRKILKTKYSNFGEQIKNSEFDFYLNESYDISKLQSYNDLVENVFWPKFRNQLGFDGVVFYDGTYKYPTGRSPAHYGTWKWKPREHLTIDLRIFNSVATFPSWDRKTEKIGWIDVKDSFDSVNSAYLLGNDGEKISLTRVPDQSETESYEFKLQEISISDKFALVGVRPRSKKSNKFMSISDTLTSYKENIGLEDIKRFYDVFILNKYKPEINKKCENPLCKFPENMLRRMSFLSACRNSRDGTPEPFNIEVRLRESPDFFDYSDYNLKRGEIENLSGELAELNFRKNEILEKTNVKTMLENYKQAIKRNITEFKADFDLFIEELNTRKPVLENKVKAITEEDVIDMVEREKLIDEQIGDIMADPDSFKRLDERYEKLSAEKKSLLRPYKLSPENFDRLSQYPIYSRNYDEIVNTEHQRIKRLNYESTHELDSILARIKKIKSKKIPLIDKLPVKTKIYEEGKWVYLDSWGKQRGTFSNEEMKEFFYKGDIIPETRVQNKATNVNRWFTVKELFPSLKNVFNTRVINIDTIPKSKATIKYLRKLKTKAEKGTSTAFLRFNFGSDQAQIFNKLINFCDFMVEDSIVYKGLNTENNERIRISDTHFESNNTRFSKIKLNQEKNTIVSDYFKCELKLVLGRRYEYDLPRFIKDKPFRIIGKRHLKSNKIDEPNFGENVDWYRKRPDSPMRYGKEIIEFIRIYYGPQGLRLMERGNRFIIEMDLLDTMGVPTRTVVKNIFPLLSQVI